MHLLNARGIPSFGSSFLILTARFTFIRKAILPGLLGSLWVTRTTAPGCNGRLYDVFSCVLSVFAAGTRDWALNC